MQVPADSSVRVHQPLAPSPMRHTPSDAHVHECHQSPILLVHVARMTVAAGGTTGGAGTGGDSGGPTSSSSTAAPAAVSGIPPMEEIHDEDEEDTSGSGGGGTTKSTRHGLRKDRPALCVRLVLLSNNNNNEDTNEYSNTRQQSVHTAPPIGAPRWTIPHRASSTSYASSSADAPAQQAFTRAVAADARGGVTWHERLLLELPENASHGQTIHGQLSGQLSGQTSASITEQDTARSMGVRVEVWDVAPLQGGGRLVGSAVLPIDTTVSVGNAGATGDGGVTLHDATVTIQVCCALACCMLCVEICVQICTLTRCTSCNHVIQHPVHPYMTPTWTPPHVPPRRPHSKSPYTCNMPVNWHGKTQSTPLQSLMHGSTLMRV